MWSSRHVNQAGIWRLKTRMLKAVSKEVVYVTDRPIRANTPIVVLKVSSKCARKRHCRHTDEPWYWAKRPLSSRTSPSRLGLEPDIMVGWVGWGS